MPITRIELEKANSDMLGNTNRAILFTTVNLGADAPRLSKMLSDLQAGIYTWEQFREEVIKRFTVKSFPEFLQKFQPCFFYRLKGPQQPPSVEVAGGNSDGADSEDQEEIAGAVETEELGEEQEESMALPSELPEYEFSLSGGPYELGWKKTLITLSHPLFKNLTQHLKERALTSRTTVQVNVDDALWGFKPQAQESLLKKSALDFQSSGKKLALEMKRDPSSSETRAALKMYDLRLEDMENAIGDELRVLPVITYGLAAARKALGSGGPSDGGLSKGAFMLEIGKKAQVVVRPALPKETFEQLPEALPEAQQANKSGEIVLLSDALESRHLAERKITDILKLNENEQYPALVGTFMSDMVRRHKIHPIMGNMLAVVLQDPRQLAAWNIAPKEVEVYHDTFLGIYSMAMERFLQAIVPLFETLMGIYALFNEFPSEVRRGQPELIITNDELTDLWRVYNEELCTFLRSSCLQATRQYKDAISFAIVPSVGPFKGKGPSSPPSGYIRAGEYVNDYHAPPISAKTEDKGSLYTSFEHLRGQKEEGGDGFGRVTGGSEVMGLMQLGKECGFTLFFSPEEKVIAGRTRPENLFAIQDNYCTDVVVEKDWAEAGALCVPDFVCLPPDGMLFTGKVMDGRSVGVEVPQLVVRSCYVAAGRYMANDNPEALKTQIARLSPEQRRALPMQVNPNLPGIGLDLMRYTAMGSANLAPDHFLSDEVIRTLLGRDRSFLVFSHVSGQSPHIAAVRTLRRVATENGSRYVMIHSRRQQIYLLRLLYAAYHKGLGGNWPSEEQMNTLMGDIINWMNWYDINRTGMVNAFPCELKEDKILVQPVYEGTQVVSFSLTLPFKDDVSGPLELSIE